jgi:hypothetical protein
MAQIVEDHLTSLFFSFGLGSVAYHCETETVKDRLTLLFTHWTLQERMGAAGARRGGREL